VCVLLVVVVVVVVACPWGLVGVEMRGWPYEDAKVMVLALP